MSAWAGFMLGSHKPSPAPSNHPKALRGLGTGVLIPLGRGLFYFFFLPIRQCLWEPFSLYSNMPLTRQEAVLISMQCVYHLRPGILIYTAVKNLAPNIFYFEPQWRGCSKGLTVLVSLLHSGGACVEEGHRKENPPNLG